MSGRLLAGLVLICSVAWGAGVQFQRITFSGEAQNGIFSVDLDGDGTPDLLALGHGRITIFRGRPGQKPLYPEEPDEVLLTGATAFFADVADVLPAKGKELLIMTPTGVACYVHEAKRYTPRPQPLLKCETLLTARPVLGSIRIAGPGIVAVLPWNFAFDADGDGRDDILVPNGNGTDVYLQKAAGEFAPAITLPLFPVVLHSALSGLQEDEIRAHSLTSRTALPVRIEYIVRKIESRDADGDGKPDLVCGGHYFAQKAGGGFETAPRFLPEPPRHRYPREELIADLNGDGKPDKITWNNSFDDPLNIVTRVRVFYADANGNIPEKPSQIIVGQNILIYSDLPVEDFMRDGTLGFAMFKTDITVTEIAKWIRQNFGEIDGSVNFYLFDKRAKAFRRSPAYAKPVHLRFKLDPLEAIAGLVWEQYLSTMMRFEGDYNGDGRPDLLVRQETNTIAIYLNTGRRDLFPRDPDVVLNGVPDFAGLAVEDLNGDGASDLVLFSARPFGPMGPQTNVVAVFLSELQ